MSVTNENPMIYSINLYQDTIERIAKNRKIMREGAQAVEHFKRLGLIRPSEQELARAKKKVIRKKHLPKEQSAQLVADIDGLRSKGMKAKDAALSLGVNPTTYRFWKRNIREGRHL